MKKIDIALVAAVVAAAAVAETATSFYKVSSEKNADLDIAVATVKSPTAYPIGVGQPMFWIDCTMTNGWEFLDGKAVKVCSRVGSRYLTKTKTYVPGGINGFPVTAPDWTLDTELGSPVLDFGRMGSQKGLFFDAYVPSEGCAATNVLRNVRTIVAVYDSSNGGGFILGGGTSGYYWSRDWVGSSFSADDPYNYVHKVIHSNNAYAYARQSRFWIDDVPNNPTASGFGGRWVTLALEPDPETTQAAGEAWGIGINDARQSLARYSGGMKIAEMLIYDTILTAEETASVRDYLNQKWLKRKWRGKDGRAELSWLYTPTSSGRSAKVTIDVAAGDTLETDVIQAGSALKAGDPRIVKTGAGAITFPNAANYNGTVELKEGSILFKSPATAAQQYPKGLVAHFDASAADSLQTLLENGTNFITKWTSIVANGYKGTDTFCLVPAAATSARRPYISPSTPFGAQKPVVDFGNLVNSGRWFFSSVNGSSLTAIPSVTTILAVVDRNPDETASIANDMYRCGFEAYNVHGAIRRDWFGDYSAAISGSGFTLLEKDGPFWINGVRHGSSDGVYHGSYCIVAKKSPCATSIQRIGTQFGTASSGTSGGGFRLAELLVFNATLTDEEVADLSDRLSVKWFGRHTDAYRTSPRGTPDIQKLDVTGDGVTIAVAAGVTARVGKLTLGARLVKEGAGTLAVESFGNETSPVRDMIEIRGGAVTTVNPSDPGQSISKLAADPSLHLDAADANSLDVLVIDGAKRVRKWHDQNFRDAAFDDAMSRCPTLDETNLQNGHPVLDFGVHGSTGARMTFGRSYESVRSAFIVWMQHTDAGSPFLLASSNRNGDFLVNRDIYDYARGTVGGKRTWNSPFIQDSFGHGISIVTNGISVANSAYPQTNVFYLVECHSLGGCHVSGLGGDRISDSSFEPYCGGIRVGEVLLYERELTEREKAATRNYLMKKWFDVDPDPAIFPPAPAAPAAVTNVAELVAAEGEVNALTVADEFAADRLTGSGTLLKSGAGTLTVADVSGFAGTLSVDEGTLRLTGGAPDESATLVTSGRILHMDATVGLSTVTNALGDIRVSSWKSALNDGWEAFPLKSATPPEVFPRHLGGQDVVEMAYNQEQALRLKKDGVWANLGNIHSIFWVIGSQNGGGLLLGGGTNALNGTQYPFHRAGTGAGAANAKDGLIDYGNAYQPLRTQASWYKNGDKTTAPWSVGLSGGWDLVSMTIPEATAEAYNYVNIEGFAYDGRSYSSPSFNARIGNQRLAEVIIYDRELSAAERIENENYLRRKWRLGVRAAVENEATLVLGSDTTLDCGGVSQYFAALEGSGSVTNGTLEAASVVADAGADGVLNVSETFVIPEGIGVSLRNLPAEGDLPLFIPILRAATFEGLENLSSAVLTGATRSGANRYRLVCRQGVLGVRQIQGLLLMVR